MKKRQMVGRLIIIMIVGVGLIVITPSVQAKSTITTVVTKPKIIKKDKVIVVGIVQLVHKNKDRISLKDENSNTYEIFLGPKWSKKDVVKVGENIRVEGMEFKSSKIVAWTVTKEDGSRIVLRSGSGKPEWIGQNTKGPKGYRSGLRESYNIR